MDESARRLSLRTRNRKITNDSDDSEPKRKKFATSQERDEKYPETDESSTSPEPACTIQQLPPEILAVIFSYLTPTTINSSRKNFRLVCKQWCDIYVQNTDAKVFFKQCVPSVHFGNCEFRKLRIRFTDVDLCKLPPSMWKKIGCKVHALTLNSCKVGDQGLKNLILNCCNLRSLQVLFNDNKDSAGDLFCSPNMLTELPITQTNLERFQIINMYPKTSVDVTHWIKTFKAFFKVFPNVADYTAGYCDRNEQFRFRFMKELDENDVNKIATSLALSLSARGSHTRQALDVASSLGLVDMSLKFLKNFYNGEDKATLIKFFNNHRNLKFIEVNLGSNSSIHMLETIFLQILQHCPNLRKLLYYCMDEFGRWLGHDNILSEIEFVKLRTMCPSLEELSVNDFKLLISHSGLSYIEYEKWQWLERSLEGIVKTYPNLQLLNLEHTSCTDKMLQSIFKHLVNLKALLLKLTHRNTDEGITGRRSNFPDVYPIVELFEDPMATASISSSGYSLNNLKNLEELELIGLGDSQLSDDVFYEFNLPKLRYFRVDRPKDPMIVLPIMGRSLPVLETICFTTPRSLYHAHNNPWAQSLVPFCQHMKKLFAIVLPHTAICLHYPETGQTMVVDNVLNIFKACPSLRFIEGYRRTCARYLPDSQEVIVTGDNDVLRNFSIK